MKLDWDKNLMIEKREKLLQKDNLSSDDLEILKFYNFYIDNKVQVKKTNKEDKQNKELSDLKKLENERQTFLNYINDPEIGGDNIKYFIESLKYLALQSDYKHISNNKVTNQDLFDTSYLVFGSLSPYFERFLDYIYQNKLVKVSKNKVNYCSNTILDLYNKLGYSSITNYDFSKKINSKEGTFNHELAHSMINTTNGDFIYKENPDLTEFHSMFMSFYTDKFMYDKTNNKKYLYSLYNTLSILKEYIKKIALMNDISKIDGPLTNRKLKKEIENNIFLSSYNIDDIIDTLLNGRSIYYMIIYLFSSCYVFNLFDKDLNDMKKMFVDSVFNNFSTYEEFLKTIDFDYTDPYIYTNLFIEKDNEIKKMVRNLEKNKNR